MGQLPPSKVVTRIGGAATASARLRDAATARLGLGNAVVDHDLPDRLRHCGRTRGVRVEVGLRKVFRVACEHGLQVEEATGQLAVATDRGVFTSGAGQRSRVLKDAVGI